MSSTLSWIVQIVATPLALQWVSQRKRSPRWRLAASLCVCAAALALAIGDAMNEHGVGKGLYAQLGVSVDATPSELRHAYHDLSRRMHPDKQRDQSAAAAAAAAEDFVRLRDAYERLSDAASRRLYDLHGSLSDAASFEPAAATVPIVVSTLVMLVLSYIVTIGERMNGARGPIFAAIALMGAYEWAVRCGGSAHLPPLSFGYLTPFEQFTLARALVVPVINIYRAYSSQFTRSHSDSLASIDARLAEIESNHAVVMRALTAVAAQVSAQATPTAQTVAAPAVHPHARGGKNQHTQQAAAATAAGDADVLPPLPVLTAQLQELQDKLNRLLIQRAHGPAGQSSGSSSGGGWKQLIMWVGLMVFLRFVTK